MKYSDAKRLFDVMSDEMTRLGGLLYGLKKDGVLVYSMSLNGQLVVSRIAKIMLDGRLDSFGKAYLALMKSDATFISRGILPNRQKWKATLMKWIL